MALISNGTTIFDNGSMASGFGGNLIFISKATASASASIEFTLGDYKEYQFYFVNIHPSNDNVNFRFNLSTDSGSNYNVAKTSTTFVTTHNEADTETAFSYETSFDLANGTGFQRLTGSIGADNDQQASGELTLFSPSSTTFVKHFISRIQISTANNFSQENYTAGYGNTTSSVNAIRFQMSSGNIDDGIIKMYGVK